MGLLTELKISDDNREIIPQSTDTIITDQTLNHQLEMVNNEMRDIGPQLINITQKYERIVKRLLYRVGKLERAHLSIRNNIIIKTKLKDKISREKEMILKNIGSIDSINDNDFILLKDDKTKVTSDPIIIQEHIKDGFKLFTKNEFVGIELNLIRWSNKNDKRYIDVFISDSKGNEPQKINMKIDTGANMTCCNITEYLIPDNKIIVELADKSEIPCDTGFAFFQLSEFNGVFLKYIILDNNLMGMDMIKYYSVFGKGDAHHFGSRSLSFHHNMEDNKLSIT